MIRQATQFEVMRVLHNLWVRKVMSVYDIKQLLLANYDLNLTTLTISTMHASSLDGTAVYKLTN